MVVCRTVAGGEVAFLTNHAPFLAALETGVVRVKTGSSEEVAAVPGSYTGRFLTDLLPKASTRRAAR